MHVIMTKYEIMTIREEQYETWTKRREMEKTIKYDIKMIITIRLCILTSKKFFFYFEKYKKKKIWGKKWD